MLAPIDCWGALTKGSLALYQTEHFEISLDC